MDISTILEGLLFAMNVCIHSYSRPLKRKHWAADLRTLKPKADCLARSNPQFENVRLSSSRYKLVCYKLVSILSSTSLSKYWWWATISENKFWISKSLVTTFIRACALQINMNGCTPRHAVSKVRWSCYLNNTLSDWTTHRFWMRWHTSMSI